VVLQVVVRPGCDGCDEASRLVAVIRGEFPELEVELHIMAGGGLPPPGAVATPAYLLDGEPIRPAALLAELTRRIRPTR
jgi:hypothetical protein